MLQVIAGRLAAGPAQLAPSLLACKMKVRSYPDMDLNDITSFLFDLDARGPEMREQ